MATRKKSYAFKAEIRQLLDILIHSLYKERDIFIRELISNASDALTRLQFEMLTRQDVVSPESQLAIWLETRKPENEEDGDAWLIIRDSGIGMTAADMQKNLGTIAQSGAREFIEKLQDNGQSPELNEVIGQFGVGFYSVFMAAQEVRVISRSYLAEEEAAVWTSSGSETYRLEAAEKTDRGTEIHIKLRPDAREFADEWHLRQVIKKHSDFVPFPIFLGEEQVNQTESLWRKPAAEIEPEDYKKFYQQMTMDFEEPLATVHFTSDAPLNVRSLLFIPAKREKTMFHRRTEPGLMLYSRNVMIQEYSADLLPRWLQFVDGVVDSEDLPLNVSRESVQNSRIMRQLGKTIRKRLLREIQQLLESEDRREPFWREYGRFFKEGLAVSHEDRDELLPLLRFHSSRSDGGLISLDQYVERMPEAQKEIYYVLGEDLKSVGNSPHLDPFTARDLEVLYLVDPFDAFMAPALTSFKDKPFRSIDDGQLEMPEIEPRETSGEEEAAPLESESLAGLLGRMKTVLGERIVEVRESQILRTSPLRLVSPDDAAHESAMSRVYRYVGQRYEVPKKIVEINGRHPLIANLARLVAADNETPLVDMAIEQLYESALVQEGLHPNPADMLPRIQKLIEMATTR